MKKKVLFVVNNFNIGGPQKSLLSLIYKLDFNLYDITLLSLSGEGSLTKYIPKQVTVIKPHPVISYMIIRPDDFIRNTIKYIFSPNYKLALGAISTVAKGKINKNIVQEKQRFWTKCTKELPKLDEEFDYAFGVSGGHSMMYIADCVNARIKVGWIRSDYRVLNRNTEIDQKYFRKMDDILSVSEMCKDIFVNIFPEEKSKVRVMYNILPFEMYENIAVDTKKLDEEQGVHKVLTICRLDSNKGLDLAIEALEKLLQRGFNIKWYVLGDGKYRKILEKVIEEKSLQNHFILLGFKFNTSEFIKKADYIVHPSRFEGKSNVIDEAKYLMKAIVATRYETVEEQITHEKTGLISDMDPGSIADNITRLINSPELIGKLQSNLQNDQTDDEHSLNLFNSIING